MHAFAKLAACPARGAALRAVPRPGRASGWSNESDELGATGPAGSLNSSELIADDADRLDLDQQVRIGEVLGGDQHARWEFALEELAANPDEFVTIGLVANHHGHGHQILQRAAGTLQRRFDVAERLPRLTREIGNL